MDISEKENSSIETTNTVEEKNVEDIEKLIDSVVHDNLSQKVIMAKENHVEEKIQKEEVEVEETEVEEAEVKETGPVRTVLSEEPLIFTIDNYLTHEECEHFVQE